MTTITTLRTVDLLRQVADVLEQHQVPEPSSAYAYSDSRPGVTWDVATDSEGDAIREGLADMNLYWSECTYPYGPFSRILSGWHDALSVSIVTRPGVR